MITAHSSRGRLRRRDGAGPETAPRQSWLAVSVDGIALALPVDSVEEVLPWDALDLDPEAPPPVCGGALVQGIWVPVVDLRRRLALSSPEDRTQEDGGDERRIVVVRGDHRRAGLLVEGISGFVEIEIPSIAPIPEGLWPRQDGEKFRHLKGLAPLGDAWLVLLDVDPLLQVSSRSASGEEDEKTGR